MDKVVTITHQVRGLEMDFTGTVSPGWLARTCEHARWESFAKTARRSILGGVVRAGAYHFLEPVTYPATLEIETWIARIGRTSFDFGQEVVRIDDGKPVMRVRATLVQVGPNGPEPIDPTFREFVLDRDAPTAPRWPEELPDVHWDREWDVRPSDQDSYKHVNQARYVDFIDDTRWLAALAENETGATAPLRTLNLEYVRETRVGHRLRMRTWKLTDTRRAFELTNLMTQELASRGQIECSPKPSL